MGRVAVATHQTAQPHVGIGGNAPQEGFEVQCRTGIGEEHGAAVLPRGAVGRERRKPPQQLFPVSGCTSVVFVGPDGDPGPAVGVVSAAPHQIGGTEQVVERLRQGIGADAEGAVPKPYGIGIDPLAGDPHAEALLRLPQKKGERLRSGRIGQSGRGYRGSREGRIGIGPHGVREKGQATGRTTDSQRSPYRQSDRHGKRLFMQK